MGALINQNTIGSPSLGRRVGTRWPFSNNYTDSDYVFYYYVVKYSRHYDIWK
ncbi:hypothetical protein WHE01_15740 [Weissella hellenica]|nr:hypothetical protein WHE01_15740 [Weissella hellenica]